MTELAAGKRSATEHIYRQHYNTITKFRFTKMASKSLKEHAAFVKVVYSDYSLIPIPITSAALFGAAFFMYPAAVPIASPVASHL